MGRWLTVIVVVLALIDGLAHLSIDLFVQHSFTKSLFAELFVLNFIGYVILIALYLYSQRASLSSRRLMNVVLIVYPLIALVAYAVITKGRYNPLGLAEIAKPAEILLIIASAVQLATLGREEHGTRMERRGATP